MTVCLYFYKRLVRLQGSQVPLAGSGDWALLLASDELHMLRRTQRGRNRCSLMAWLCGEGISALVLHLYYLGHGGRHTEWELQIEGLLPGVCPSSSFPLISLVQNSFG